MPCQIVRQARRVIYRVLGYKACPHQKRIHKLLKGQ